MDAPLRAYITGSDGRPSRLSGCLVARFLRDYSTSDAAMQSEVLRLFSLDALLLVRTETQEGTRVGFVGMVLSGGARSGLRDMERRDSGLRVRIGDSEYALLNDAGLDTLAGLDSIINAEGGVTGSGYEGRLFINMVSVRFSTSNALYGGASWTLYAEGGSPSSRHVLDSGGLSPGGRLSTRVWSGPLPGQLTAGDSVRFVLSVANGEGTRPVEAGPYILMPPVAAETVYRTSDRSDEWNTGEAVRVYIGERDLAWLLSQTGLWETGAANVEVDPDDLPDGGLVLDGLMRPLTDGDYNLRGYVGFQYSSSLGRIRYVYQPNPGTSEGYWKVIVSASVDTFGGSGGWPESPGMAYRYRVRVSARFEAVADPPGDPPSVTLADMGIRGVNESGDTVLGLIVDTSLFTDSELILPSDPDARAVTSTYIYARQSGGGVPSVYGIAVIASVSPEGTETDFPVTRIG